MRSRLAVLLSVCVLVAMPGAASAQALPESDWVLVKITAGAEGATDVELRGEGELVYHGEDPAMLGSGVGGAGPAFVSVFALGGGPTKLATTDDLGGVDVTLAPKSTGQGSFTTGTFIGGMRPGETIARLIFVTGLVLREFSFDPPVAETGSVGISVTTGTGSRPLLQVAHGDEGPAVEAANAAAGMSAHAETPGAGLVGGFTSFECGDVCTTSWSSPDGRTGSQTFVAAHADVIGLGFGFGSQSYAGPGGGWRWTWRGALRPHVFSIRTRPAYGAWAPIGDDWTLFAG